MARSSLARSLVDIHPAEAVTRIGREDARNPRMDGVWRDVQQLYRTGLHPAVALHVRHRGRVVLDRTVGHLDNAPKGIAGRVVTPDSLFNLFSGSKIVTAALVMALVDDGVLDLERPAAHWVPEFGRHGKERILLRHLLNHTAGIPDMPPGVDVPAALATGNVPIEGFCDLHPLSSPGERAAYHPITSWVILQAIVERATGRSLRTALAERLLQPLGFRTLNYGVPADRLGDVALHAVTGPPAPAPMEAIFRRTIGIGLDEAVRLTNDPRFLQAVLPSANVIGEPRETARFLAMLLGGGAIDGVRVMSERTARRMYTEITPRQFDGTLMFPMRYGLGVMMGGRRFSLFGLDTPGAFGHLGLSNVVVFADPSRDLVVSFLTTGKPLMDLGMLRWYRVLQRIVSVAARR